MQNIKNADQNSMEICLSRTFKLVFVFYRLIHLGTLLSVSRLLLQAQLYLPHTPQGGYRGPCGRVPDSTLPITSCNRTTYVRVGVPASRYWPTLHPVPRLSVWPGLLASVDDHSDLHSLAARISQCTGYGFA